MWLSWCVLETLNSQSIFRQLKIVDPFWSMLNPQKVEVKKHVVFFRLIHCMAMFQIANATWRDDPITTSQHPSARLNSRLSSQHSNLRDGPRGCLKQACFGPKLSTETNGVKKFQIIKLVKHPWKHWWKVTWMEICVALVDSLHPHSSYQLASVLLKTMKSSRTSFH